ncbi:MAG: mercury(II) reductase [Longimicrobiales bacterium]
MKSDMDYDYDLLIVGSGAAGMAAAIRTAELNRTAAVVEGANVVGGTCVNVGCIPSKNLIEVAAHYHAARTGFPGISECDPELAWQEVQAGKAEMIGRLRQEKYLDVIDSYEGVSLLRGRAELLGGGRIRVGDREVKARKIVLATGTRPAFPPIPGLQEAGALDSTSAMELERLPKSLIVIGGGAVGLELGQAFSRFGVHVTVLEAMASILPTEDADISEALTEALRAEGIKIHTGVTVSRVARDSGGYTIRLQNGESSRELEAEQLLVATGRRPNTETLGLDAAGVETNRAGFVEVDEFMRTSNPDVFAAGEVAGLAGFVYVAALSGGIAAQAALAELSGEQPIAIDLTATPRITFTDPQVAAVGVVEAEAKEAGFATNVASLAVAHLPRATVSYRRSGLIKLVADTATDRLLGAHIVSANAGDVIGEATIAIRFGVRVQEVVSSLHPYLTWGEGLKLAAQTFTKDVAQLSCCA